MTITHMIGTLYDLHHLAREAARYPRLGNPRIECGTEVVGAFKKYARSITPDANVDALPLTVLGIPIQERDDMEPGAWRAVFGEGRIQP